MTIGLKTGDVPLAAQPPAILITTPESTDSLLTRSPKIFTGRTIAHTDRSYPPGTVVLFGGQPMRVA